eukprot:m.46756 g.46756  ORF g.46756 m.46756 type:complete len:373 (-) comp11879_c0_seq1:157-1275(-)
MHGLAGLLWVGWLVGCCVASAPPAASPSDLATEAVQLCQEAVGSTSFAFDCHTTFEQLPGVPEPSMPFGRGWQKQVHRARTTPTDGDGAVEFVIKAAVQPSGVVEESAEVLRRRFAQAAPSELGFLRRHWHPGLMCTYGMCAQTKTYAAEPHLAKFAYVAAERGLPWCARFSLIKQLVELARFFDSEAVLHCDWKPDQLGINPDGRVKVVDLDSFVSLSGAGPALAYGANRRCTSDDQCSPMALSCFKHTPTVDGVCDLPAGRCVGFDNNHTMIYTIGQRFLPLVFPPDNPVPDVPDDNFHKQVQRLANMMAKPDRRKRWGLALAIEYLADMHAEHPVDKCLESQGEATRAAIQRAYTRRVESDNCAKARYC